MWAMATESLTVIDGPDSPAVYEHDQRKSRFIAQICHLADVAEVGDIVARVRSAAPKARHVVHVAVLGIDPGSRDVRMSDDGEPSGTASRPILEVLRSRGLTDCLIVVTRYFGGVLLGAGGLARAYSAAASGALGAATQAVLTVYEQYDVEADYSAFAVVNRIVSRVGGRVSRADYTQSVRCGIVVPESSAGSFERLVVEETAGMVVPRPRGAIRMPRPLASDGDA